MRNSFVHKINELIEEEEMFATATIVRRRKPSSGKPGDRAVITKDGHVHGWIGGGCTRGIVIKEALLSLQDRKPRFVSISPEKKNGEFDNTKLYTMTCQSGGEVEVYIEPVLPKPQIVIFGTSHISMSLAKIAKAIDYRVDVFTTIDETHVFPEVDTLKSMKEFVADDISKSAFLVVCTQGEGDAQALMNALSVDNTYVSFVASRKKANAIYTEVRGMGGTFDQLKKIKTPAGIDIGAKTPDEVAISILAEIINAYRSDANQDKTADPAKLEIKNDDLYMNPVCNIPVRKSTAKHIIEYKGENVYFCCDGCKVSFENAPEKYMAEE